MMNQSLNEYELFCHIYFSFRCAAIFFATNVMASSSVTSGGGSGKRSRSTSPTPSRSTLSKQSLYAPLTTYISHEATSQSSTASVYLKIPKSRTEPALYDHLTTISETYHCPKSASSTALKGGNNGGQALRRRTYEDRLKQRSLVLVGGGLNTGVAGTDGIASVDTDAGGEEGQGMVVRQSMVDRSRGQRRKRKRDRGQRVRGCISNSERKRRSQASAEQDAAVSRDGKGATNSRGKSTNSAGLPHEAVIALNELWNRYICNLLGGQGTKFTERPPSELSSLLSKAELIGAYVRIAQCDSNRSLVGREGIVVDATVNTWRIALPKRYRKVSSEGSDKGAKEGKETAAGDGGASKKISSLIWKECIVPKHRSELILSIQSDFVEKFGDNNGGDDAEDESNKKEREEKRRSCNVIIRG